MNLIIKGKSTEYKVKVERATNNGFIVKAEGKFYKFNALPVKKGALSLIDDSGKQKYITYSVTDNNEYTISLAEKSYTLCVMDQLEAAGSAVSSASVEGVYLLKAPIAGKIAKICVSEGENVQKGEVLLVLEAMKMQNEIQTDFSGVINKVFVKEGKTVSNDEALIEIKIS